MPMGRPLNPTLFLNLVLHPHNATCSCSRMCLQHLHTDEAPLLVYVGHSDSWLFGAYYLPEDNIGADIKRNRFEFWIHGLLAF